MLLDEKGRSCTILDWENCTSNLAPYWELSIALHDLCIDEKEQFLEGYGLSIAEWLPLEIPASDSTRRYLKTKKEKLGHKLSSV